ncbi:hypothetical protein ATCC90586_010752 [Pythium insidiosum]|nr:hypothetical protein ATCC90586_010752 [Pythium insidiosum]
MPVVEIWQKQCRGWRIGSGSAQVLAIAAALALGTCLLAEHDSERLSVDSPFFILPVLVLSCLPMLIWQHVLWDSSFDAGRSHSLWKWGIALLFAVSILRGFVAPIVWAATPHAEQTQEAASESASDGQERRGAEENDQQLPSEQEQDESETAGGDEKAKCDCHYHCCKCGKEVLSSALKRRYPPPAL